MCLILIDTFRLFCVSIKQNDSNVSHLEAKVSQLILTIGHFVSHAWATIITSVGQPPPPTQRCFHTEPVFSVKDSERISFIICSFEHRV